MPTDHTPKDDLFAPNGWLRRDVADDTAYKALERSVAWAANMGWESLRTPHIFMGLLAVADGRVCDCGGMVGSVPARLLLSLPRCFGNPRRTPIPACVCTGNSSRKMRSGFCAPPTNVRASPDE